MIEVPNLKTLCSLPNKPQDGERAKIESTGKIYQFNEEINDWEDFVPVTLFDYQKQIYSQRLPYSDDDYEQAAQFINDIYREQFEDGKFFMLSDLMKLRYITMFIFNPMLTTSFGTEVLACCREIGDVVGCNYNEDCGCIEIWIKNGEEIYELRLFDYTDGTVEVG